MRSGPGETTGDPAAGGEHTRRPLIVAYRRVSLRAKRRWGELLPEKQAKPNPTGVNQHTRLVTACDQPPQPKADLQAESRARTLAAVPQPTFDAHLEQADPDALLSEIAFPARLAAGKVSA